MPPGPHQNAPDGWSPPPAAGGTVIVARLMQVLALVAVPLGLAIPFDDTSMWATSVAWCVLATLAALAQLAPVLAGSIGGSPSSLWRAGAVATAVLVAFWVLLVLPAISSNASFVVTLGVAAAATGCWYSPGRPVGTAGPIR